METTIETLAGIYRIAKMFMYVDDVYSDDELQPLADFLGSFDGMDDDSVKQIIAESEKMELAHAVQLLAELDDEGKRQVAELFSRISLADGELADEEKALYWKVRELCGLPDPGDDSGEEDGDAGEAAPAGEVGLSTFEGLAALIAVCLGIARTDDNLDESEITAIMDGLNEQYDFEGRDDLLESYFDAAVAMDVKEAIRMVRDFPREDKQYASDMIFLTIAADGKLTDDEDLVYRNMLDVCGLPMSTRYIQID